MSIDPIQPIGRGEARIPQITQLPRLPRVTGRPDAGQEGGERRRPRKDPRPTAGGEPEQGESGSGPHIDITA